LNEKPIAAGKSSFDLIDSKKLFSELQLKKGSVLLDLACGRGLYSIAASEYIGEQGKIYAVDLWQEGIDFLIQETTAGQIVNIHASVADINKHIPFADHSIDVCLMATVLHDLIEDHAEKGTLKEVKRVLKPEGLLAVIEFIKRKVPPDRLFRSGSRLMSWKIFFPVMDFGSSRRRKSVNSTIYLYSGTKVIFHRRGRGDRREIQEIFYLWTEAAMLP